MRKMALVVVLLSLLITRSIVGQQHVDPDKGEVQIYKLVSNLYMLQFVSVSGGRGMFGGNVVASVGDDGIVLVDTGYAAMAPKLAAALKALSDKPVKYILHTHWHVDHSQADGYFLVRPSSLRRIMYGRGCEQADKQAATPSHLCHRRPIRA